MSEHQTNRFELNITKVNNIFKEIFVDFDFVEKFMRLFFQNRELNEEILNKEQVNKIKEALQLLVANAMVTETRKMQQNYYMEVISTIQSNNFNGAFLNNNDFRLKFLELMIMFLDKNNSHHNDAPHHVFIVNAIENAIKEYIGGNNEK